jgi:trimethylamine---corrinoid protein Co-methyltransferase
MLDFESCFSLEKLVLDNQIISMSSRLMKGIEPKDDFPIVPRMEELLREKHMLISSHTMQYLDLEHLMPSEVIDRANRMRYREEGSRTLGQRARQQIEELLRTEQENTISDEVSQELTALMKKEAKQHGMDKLPDLH